MRSTSSKSAGYHLPLLSGPSRRPRRARPRRRLSNQPSQWDGLPASPDATRLDEHNCVNLRLPTSGALYAWEFAKDGREFSVRVEGQLTMSNIDPALNAALDGVGLSYAPKDLVRQHLESGRLQEVLADWAPTFQGYHLYYPSRRHPSPAFAAFVEAFRYRQR